MILSYGGNPSCQSTYLNLLFIVNTSFGWHFKCYHKDDDYGWTYSDASRLKLTFREHLPGTQQGFFSYICSCNSHCEVDIITLILKQRNTYSKTLRYMSHKWQNMNSIPSLPDQKDYGIFTTHWLLIAIHYKLRGMSESSLSFHRLFWIYA